MTGGSARSGPAPAGAADAATVDVHLLHYPLATGVRASQHYNDVLREFALIASDEPEHSSGVPKRLLELVDALTARYAPQDEHEAERDAAFARGEVARDFTISLPVSAGDACAVLDQMLDETDEFCRDGSLLTLAAPDDVVAFRRWYLREVQEQTSGRGATPWAGSSS